jgi:hypothetical protein
MNRRNPLFVILSLALPLATGTLAMAPSIALADPPAEAAQAAPPVAIDGRFQRFVLSPRGKVTGMVLADGTVVRLPHRAIKEDPANLKPGALVHVEGVMKQTPNGNVIRHAVVQHGGKVIADARGAHGHKRGHHGKGKGRHGKGKRQHAPLAPVQAAGRIMNMLPGEVAGMSTMLLDDGTTVIAGALDGLGLKIGDRVSLAGNGGAYPLGKAMVARTITLPNGQTRELPAPQHRRHHEEPRADDHA